MIIHPAHIAARQIMNADPVALSSLDVVENEVVNEEMIVENEHQVIDEIDNCLLACYVCLDGSPYLLDCANNHCMKISKPSLETLAEVSACPLFHHAGADDMWHEDSIMGKL